MGIEKLNELQQIPVFEMPDKYKNDTWHITEWEYYKTSLPEYQILWKKRSNITNNTLAFSLCENPCLREELKYCFYYFIEHKENKLHTISEKYDHLKHVMRFLNLNSYNSITEDGVIEAWNTYFLTQTKNKSITQNGSVVTSELKKATQKKRNRAITFFETCVQIINDYYLKDIPETQKDVWYSKNLKIIDKIPKDRYIHFEGIKIAHFKKLTKEYTLIRLNNTCFSTVSTLVYSICTFFEWLYEYDSKIDSLHQINRDIIECFLIWIKTKSGYSKQKTNNIIRITKQFLDFGDMYDKTNFPKKNLFLDSDFTSVIKKEPNPLTDEEFKECVRDIKVMDKKYGRFVYVLMLTGMRISELIFLTIDSLEKREDGKYQLVLHQFKTVSEYEKPTFEAIQKVIDLLVKSNIKQFGKKAKYVFVNSDNKPFSESTINKHFKTALMQINAKDRNGKSLECNFHRFRSTIATNYVDATGNIEGTSKLLGHSNIKSLASYLSVKTDTVKKQLKPRLDKDEILISSIGLVQEFDSSMFENLIPLANGWCSKNPNLGICKKANACIFCDLFVPTPRHLPTYKLQLLNIEATIEAARANKMDSILENS